MAIQANRKAATVRGPLKAAESESASRLDPNELGQAHVWSETLTRVGDGFHETEARAHDRAY